MLERSQELVAKARTLAAHLLEADEADLHVGADGVEVAGAPQRSITWAEPRRRRPMTRARLPAGMATGLRTEGVYREPSSTFPFGAHVAVVEVDTQTGDVRLVRHIAVDDCGRVLNPMLVEGQVHGGPGPGHRAGALRRGPLRRVGQPR